MRSTVQCAWTCYTMFNRILKWQFTFDLIDFSIFASTFKIDDDYNMKIYGKGHPLCAAVGFFETSCERRCQINKLLLETKKNHQEMKHWVQVLLLLLGNFSNTKSNSYHEATLQTPWYLLISSIRKKPHKYFVGIPQILNNHKHFNGVLIFQTVNLIPHSKWPSELNIY